MTKDEIKKALEVCKFKFDCEGCPYEYAETGYCRVALKRNALDIIAEQEQEIERLKDENKQAKIEVLEELRNRAWNKSDWSAVVIELIDELELN